MKIYIKLYLLFVFLFGFINLPIAQTYEEFQKNEEEQFNKFKLEQEKEIAKLAKQFDNYVKQADKEFEEFLKMEWEQYQAFQGIDIPERPKPVEIPKLKPNISLNELSTKEIKVLLPKEETNTIANRPLLPIIQKTETFNYLSSAISFDYYGTKLSVQMDDKLNQTSIQSVNEQGIGNWWAESSNANYNLAVNRLLTVKDELSLNDWAFFQLVNKTSAAMVNNDTNRTRLLTWFLMIRSGYKVKVAFDENNIFLLFPSVNELYGRSFLMIEGDRYYFTDDISSNTFQTYSFDFPGATRVIDFNIYQPLNIGNDVIEKQIKFTHVDKDYSFPVSLSINTLYLLKDYPVTDLSVFFNAAMSRVTKQSLAEGLMPFIHDMSSDEALNFLLAFVQKSFKYSTDQEQFDKEKFFFPEELFYYPGSDCEDRSALFTYIVKQLLHLEVIGLEYEGHVATAVNTNKATQGDYLYYNNTKYVIADPTYVNAPLGLTMPKYKNQDAKIIETNNSNYLANVSDNYWELTNKLGGYRGNNLCDSKYDSQGNCYLTGYYSQNVNFADEDWYSDIGKRQAFIIKFNKDKEVQWAKNIAADGIASGFAITLDDSENPVIAGSFNGVINAGDYTLGTIDNKEDIFVAAYSADGDLLWLEKSGLDTINYSEFLVYVVKFDDNGQHLKTNLYLENASNTSNGIFCFDNSFTIVGGVNFTISYSTTDLSFDAGNDFNTITYLKSENDMLIDNNVDKSIAGLVAVINLIKSSGMIIPGIEAQKALDKYNPEFRSLSESIYKNIGKITFMKNNDGIIHVKTNNNKSVSFDKIKISNGAKIKIVSLQNGNEQIDILSGIEVGKAFIWYDLNFIRMLRDSGDLLFDYDSDHTQKIVNMKDDILD